MPGHQVHVGLVLNAPLQPDWLDQQQLCMAVCQDRIPPGFPPRSGTTLTVPLAPPPALEPARLQPAIDQSHHRASQDLRTVIDAAKTVGAQVNAAIRVAETVLTHCVPPAGLGTLLDTVASLERRLRELEVTGGGQAAGPSYAHPAGNSQPCRAVGTPSGQAFVLAQRDGATGITVGGHLLTTLIVDSGSVVTVAPTSTIRRLGLDVAAAPDVSLTTLGGDAGGLMRVRGGLPLTIGAGTASAHTAIVDCLVTEAPMQFDILLGTDYLEGVYRGRLDLGKRELELRSPQQSLDARPAWLLPLQALPSTLLPLSHVLTRPFPPPAADTAVLCHLVLCHPGQPSLATGAPKETGAQNDAVRTARRHRYRFRKWSAAQPVSPPPQPPSPQLSAVSQPPPPQLSAVLPITQPALRGEG